MEELEINLEVLAKLDRNLEDLKRDYEQYFLGTLRIPPEREFARIQGVIRKLRQIYTNNTAVKFRMESLVSRFQSMSRYWSRIMKEIEEGRYVRDRFKADIRVGKADKAAEAGRAKGSADQADKHMDNLYKEYMMARLECNQPTEGFSKEKLKASIEKTLPQLKQRYKGKDLQFRVVVEDGKAKLKALPK